MNTSIENYLKGIYVLSQRDQGVVTTNALARQLEMKASSVTDMLRKLDERGLVRHTPYHGADLTPKGRKIAVSVIRKHRLWELFLVEKLGFGWDEVHEVAEQLEHVESDRLVDSLDDFLGHPTHDPHGDPIPDRQGNMPSQKLEGLDTLAPGTKAVVRGVRDHSPSFLKHLGILQIKPGQKVQLTDRMEYDGTCILLLLPSRVSLQVSLSVASNLLVQKT